MYNYYLFIFKNFKTYNINYYDELLKFENLKEYGKCCVLKCEEGQVKRLFKTETEECLELIRKSTGRGTDLYCGLN